MGQAAPSYEGSCNSSWLYADRPDGKPLALVGAQGPDCDKVPKPRARLLRKMWTSFRLAQLCP